MYSERLVRKTLIKLSWRIIHDLRQQQFNIQFTAYVHQRNANIYKLRRNIYTLS